MKSLTAVCALLSLIAMLVLCQPVAAQSGSGTNTFTLRGHTFRVELQKEDGVITRSYVSLWIYDTSSPASTAAGYQPAVFTCPTGSCVNPANLLECPSGAAPVLVRSQSINAGSGAIETWQCPGNVAGNACIGASGFINFMGGEMLAGVVMIPYAVTIGKDPAWCS